MSRRDPDAATRQDGAATPAPEWTESNWQAVWFRTLGHADRHRFSMSVLKREVPDGALARRVVPELARRWRRQMRNLGLVWLAFAIFWALLAVDGSRYAAAQIADGDLDAAASGLPPWLIGVGTFVAAALFGVRWWIGPVARHDQP